MSTMGKINRTEKKTTELKLLGKNSDNFDKLVRLVDEVGDWNINYLKFSKEWGIPDTTIYRWREKILQEMPPINPTELGSNMVAAVKTSIKQCQLKIKTATTEADRRGYMNTLSRLTDNLTDLLERYEYKHKPVERHENLNVNVNMNTLTTEEKEKMIKELIK